MRDKTALLHRLHRVFEKGQACMFRVQRIWQTQQVQLAQQAHQWSRWCSAAYSLSRSTSW